MTFIIIIIIISIIIAIGFGIASGIKNQKALSESLKNIPNFTITKKIDDGSNGLAYDEQRKKICLFTRNGSEFNIRIFSFSDILSSEIFEDGSSLTKTARGSQIGGALIGGLALGPVGLLLGGLTGKKKNIEKVNSIDLQITVKDLGQPTHIINFLNIESEKNGFLYQNSINLARQWHSIIEILIKNADAMDDENTPKSKVMPFSISDELKKLAELKESGILTDSEYEQQKRKLLDH